MNIEHWPAGIKRTKQRINIWNVLLHSKRPLTAAEIAAQTGNAQQNVWMSTSYRTLDFLVAKGLVTRTNLAHQDMALYELTPHTHRHYAICTQCHKMIPLADCPLKDLSPQLVHEDFTITGHNLEIYGLCHECQAKSAHEKKPDIQQ